MDATWSWPVGALALSRSLDWTAQPAARGWTGGCRPGGVTADAQAPSQVQPAPAFAGPQPEPLQGCNVRRRRKGAVLFEVILALALLLGAAAVIGGGMTAAIQSVERLRLTAHAMDLAVTVVSELQLGSVAAQAGEVRPFPAPFQDWTWEVVTQPLEGVGATDGPIRLVEVVIRHKAPPFVYRLTHPLPVLPSRAPGEAAASSTTAW